MIKSSLCPVVHQTLLQFVTVSEASLLARVRVELYLALVTHTRLAEHLLRQIYRARPKSCLKEFLKNYLKLSNKILHTI